MKTVQILEVTTIKDGNTRTAQRGVPSRSEHRARRKLIDYYLAKGVQVKAIKFVREAVA
mgnify:CR=1 FL=1